MMEPYMTNPDRLNQINFRTLLQAMGQPGRTFRLQLPLDISSFSAMTAVADCLLDPEVAFAVIGNGSASDLERTLCQRNGGRVSDITGADYLFVTDLEMIGGFSEVRCGDITNPENGATIIYHMDTLRKDGTGRFRVRLQGPGIEHPAGIAPEMRELTMELLKELAEINADYPLGVDAVFVRPGGEVMCIPRSTRISLS